MIDVQRRYRRLADKEVTSQQWDQTKKVVYREEREDGIQHGFYIQVHDQAEEKVAQIMPQREQARLARESSKPADPARLSGDGAISAACTPLCDYT